MVNARPPQEPGQVVSIMGGKSHRIAQVECRSPGELHVRFEGDPSPMPALIFFEGPAGEYTVKRSGEPASSGIALAWDLLVDSL